MLGDTAMIFTPVRVVMGSLFIFSAYKWGDWKNLRRYYPTMLFFGMGDLIYHIVFCEKTLWRFELDLLAKPINELFVIFAIFFPTVLLYISRFPNKRSLKIAYILFWILLYMGIEIFTLKIGMLTHHNGWTIWWSLLHNTVQFLLVFLHHKNPVWAWIIALIFLFLIMHIFNVPYTL
jgi:hypothetical protein